MKIDDRPSALPLRLDRVVVAVATLLVSAMALVAPFFVDTSGMPASDCSGTCDHGLVGLGGAVVVHGPLAAALIALIGLLVLHRADRFLWWLPCCALVIAIGLALIGNHLVDLGVTS